METAAVAANVRGLFETIGDFASFSAQVIRAARKLPREAREAVTQFDALGARSMVLVAVAGAATGVVLSMQTRASLVRFGAESVLPSLIIFSMIKEMGPVITALVVSGQAGARIGAELGSMRVTDQIDALEASAVNPFEYLVATRVLACVVAMPLLTLIADGAGIVAGWMAMTMTRPISLTLFLNRGLAGATFNDFLPSTLKTMVFGWIIGTMSCYQGMRTSGGTEGVGRASTYAVVLSSLLIILADVFLVRLILVFFS
jgi:phospholipid/cholesterol/gamma-HCH transport system permease protein